MRIIDWSRCGDTGKKVKKLGKRYGQNQRMKKSMDGEKMTNNILSHECNGNFDFLKLYLVPIETYR